MDDFMRQALYGKRKPGRPAVPPAERKHACSFYIHPTDEAYLQDLGQGNRSEGLAMLIRFHKAQKQAALDAIKGAAERRDQSAVRSPFDE